MTEENKDLKTGSETEFITEKVIDSRKKKFFKRLGTLIFVIICAICFGVISRIAYLFVDRKLTDVLLPSSGRQEVTIKTKDDKDGSGNNNNPVVTEAPTDKPADKPTEAPTNKPTDPPENKPTQPVSEPTYTPAPTPTKAAEVTPAPTPVTQSLTSFYAMYTEVEKAIDLGKKCCVDITVTKNSVNYFGDVSETESNTTGLLVGFDSVSILVLTDYASVDESTGLRVKFYGDFTAKGEIYSRDIDYGIAIIEIPMSELAPDDFEGLTYCTLGTLDEIKLGSPVVAVGRANGYSDSIAFGMITGKNISKSVRDGEIGLFTTDMVDSEEASAFVFDMEGSVLGMIAHAQKLNANDGITGCVSLDSIRKIITKYTNGIEMAYFGIRGTAISASLITESGLEHGLYVLDSIASSPAWIAGIRKGDIITSINGNPVSNMSDVIDLMTSVKPGSVLNVSYVRLLTDGTKTMDVTVNTSGKR